MLTNPVYAGFVEIDGERIPRHKGIITPQEFDRVRRLLDGRALETGQT